MFFKNLKIRLLNFFLIVFILSLFFSCTLTKNTNAREVSTPLSFNSSVEKGTLSNGMQFFVQKNSEPKNRICLRLVVKAGSCMEEDDQLGVAHFVEHMAFNGTENFKKNDLVNYFESIGMKFGPEVNAYTTFEETIYMLEIPADDPEMLRKAMLVLHDWASAISFEQDELEKERSVIVEEWRMRMQGLSGRITDQVIPVVLGNSQFENRLPIGDMQIIKNISRERVVDFYKKWYRPDNMSIILVGDIDTSIMKDAIKSAMQSIKAPTDKFVRPSFPIPKKEDSSITLIRDKELPYPVIEIYNQTTDEPSTTEYHLNEYFKTLIFTGIMNERLKTITTGSDSPWIVAQVNIASFANLNNLAGFIFVPKDKMFEKSFKTLIDEYDRFLLFGATDTEIERQKKNLLASAEQNYNARSTISSDSNAQALVTYVTLGHVPLSAENNFELHKKLLPKITAEDIQNTAKDFMKNRGNFLFVEIPEKNTEIPDDNNELRNLWKNYKNESIIAYEDDSTETGLGNKPSTKASIVKTEKIKELDTSVYELSNGAKIILKKTDFDKNSILFSAFSYGGLSKYKQKDILSAKYSTFYAIQSGINGLTYAQMSKALAGSTATISNISIKPYAESMSGKSSTQDIETLLNLVYQFSANPQFSDDSWNNLMPQLQMMADTRDAQPQQVFINKINELIFGNDVRFLSPKPKDLDFMNKEQSAKIFKECFGNAADFTYTFVGDFDEDYLLELCQYYIGNIPGDKSKCDTVKFNEKTFPNGNIRETIKKGIGNQGMVYIAFGGNLKSEKDVTANWIRAETTYPLSSLLSIKLREEIRENLGGTYNISAQIGGLSSNDISEPSNFISEFSFDCEPERADELKNAVIKTLKELSEQPIDDATLTKILEEYKRDKEKNLRSNNWWINELECALVLKLEPISSLHDYETIPSGLTKDNIQKLIKKYCNTDDYMCVILLPENE